jgi:2-keto-4-pentenoate hydratase/2-oxohepta-3-ene-1,7-dioic acid hydratase in catechol pathway
MRLVSFRIRGRNRFGVVAGNGVVDLTGRTPYAGVRELIADEGRVLRGKTFSEADADVSLDDITYLVPVPDADKIICVGVNYPDRNAEYKDGTELPKYPSLFLRTRGSFVGHRAPLQMPLESVQFDYEGEIVVVIGKSGRRIPQADALRHVFGLSICNEGSVRDWMRHAKFNVTQGKNFEASGSIGPWIKVVEQESDLADLHLKTFVNDELRQEDVVERMMFPISYLIHYISTFTELCPGDIIVTGTPTGSGARFDPPRFLKAGDRVRVEVSKVGALENVVEAERTEGRG